MRKWFRKGTEEALVQAQIWGELREEWELKEEKLQEEGKLVEEKLDEELKECLSEMQWEGQDTLTVQRREQIAERLKMAHWEEKLAERHTVQRHQWQWQLVNTTIETQPVCGSYELGAVVLDKAEMLDNDSDTLSDAWDPLNAMPELD